MSIAFRSVSTGSAYSASSVAVAAPSGLQVGDTMLAFSFGYATAPTGWTQLASIAPGAFYAGSGAIYVFSKTATASDVSGTQTFSGGTTGRVVVLAYSGQVSSCNAFVTGQHVSAGTWSWTTPGASSVSAGSVVVSSWAADTDYNVSGGNTLLSCSVTGFTDRANASEVNGEYPDYLIGDQAISSSGAVAGLSVDPKVVNASTLTGWTVVLASDSPPNAPTWVTPQNSTIPADQDAYIELAFSDPDPGDSMSASNWKRWALDANGNRVGTAVTTYQPTPSTQLLIPAGTLTSGTKYEFQADTLDSQGVEGPYSASLFVTAQNTPAQPTWTDPISGQTIGTSSYTGVISDPTVDESEWTLYADDGAGNIDTSTILQGPVTVSTGDVRSHTFTGLANNTPIWWSARVKYQGLWSQPNQIRTPVSYSPPPAPQVTLTPDVANGALVVGITNPAPGSGQPATSYNNVYVDDGKGKGKERVATMLPTNTPWTYPWPVSLRDYTGNLWVEAVATNGTTAETVA